MCPCDAQKHECVLMVSVCVGLRHIDRWERWWSVCTRSVWTLNAVETVTRLSRTTSFTVRNLEPACYEHSLEKHKSQSKCLKRKESISWNIPQAVTSTSFLILIAVTSLPLRSCVVRQSFRLSSVGAQLSRLPARCDSPSPGQPTAPEPPCALKPRQLPSAVV